MTTYTTTAIQDPHTITVTDDPDLVTITLTQEDVVLNLDPVEFTAAVTSVAGKIGAVTLDTDDVAEAGNLYYTDERVDDRVAALVQSGNGIDVEYDDSANTFTITSEVSEFTAKNRAGQTITKGTPVYISGHSGNTTEIGIADADDPNKMPAFGIAEEDIGDNNNGTILTYGVLRGFDTSSFSVGDELYVSNTGTLVNTRPTLAADAVQKMAKVVRSHAQNGILFVMGAGRTNDIPNLNSGQVFIGNGSGYDTRALTTSDVSEGTNLYYTDARADARAQLKIDALVDGAPGALDTLNELAAAINDDADVYNTLNGLITTNASNIALKFNTADFNSTFDTRLATKDTDDVAEGTTNLYYTTARANTDFDTRLATKSTTNLSEGTNLYYTDARANSAIDSRVTGTFIEGLDFDSDGGTY